MGRQRLSTKEREAITDIADDMLYTTEHKNDVYRDLSEAMSWWWVVDPECDEELDRKRIDEDGYSIVDSYVVPSTTRGQSVSVHFVMYGESVVHVPQPILSKYLKVMRRVYSYMHYDNVKPRNPPNPQG